METCPRCDQRVERLHFLPPGALTRGLVDTFGPPDAATDIELCSGCVDELASV